MCIVCILASSDDSGEMPLIKMKSALDSLAQNSLLSQMRSHYAHTHNADAIICYRILSDVGITLNSMLVIVVYFFHFLSMNLLLSLSAYDAYDRFNQCLQINYAGYFQLSSSRSLCFVSFSFTLCRAFSQFLSSRFLLSVFSLLGATRTVKVSHSTSLTVIHRKQKEKQYHYYLLIFSQIYSPIFSLFSFDTLKHLVRKLFNLSIIGLVHQFSVVFAINEQIKSLKMKCVIQAIFWFCVLNASCQTFCSRSAIVYPAQRVHLAHETLISLIFLQFFLVSSLVHLFIIGQFNTKATVYENLKAHNILAKLNQRLNLCVYK